MKKVVGENLVKGSGSEYYRSVKDMNSVTIADVFTIKINRLRALSIALSAIDFSLVDPEGVVCNIAMDMENEVEDIHALVDELLERVKNEPEANVA